MQILKALQQRLKRCYYDKDSAPKQCHNCKSHRLKDEVKGTVAGHACEVDIYCKECGEHLAFYAYGYYQPYF